MYLHIGQDVLVRTGQIVGIFDLENTSVSRLTKQFLATAEKRGEVVNVCTDLPKSIVLCEHKGIRRIYITQISPATLRRRSESGSEMG